MLSDLYLRDRTRVSQRVDEEFRRTQRERAEEVALFKDLRAGWRANWPPRSRGLELAQRWRCCSSSRALISRPARLH